MKTRKRIGILTGGGDCPGLNGVIRAVSKKAIIQYDMDVIGILDGYEGLVERKYKPLVLSDVSNILTLGGTILGTTNKANPYKYAQKDKEGNLTFVDRSKEVISFVKEELKLDCLVCIGGDGTLHIANQLYEDGIPVLGVPKTIDNDLRETDITFGFDTAVSIVTEGIDRVHTTAEAHQRIMIVEVMGRTAGWIALHSGVAGGGDVILIPEIPYSLDVIVNQIKERKKKGKRYTIIVVSEGAKPIGGDVVIRKIVADSHETVRLGGIGFQLADALEEQTGIESRTVVMGHLQRGGTPSSADRVLATRLGTKVIDLLVAGEFGKMVAVQCDSLTAVPLKKVAQGPDLIPLDHPLILSARSIGTYFGDEEGSYVPMDS